MKRFDDSHVRVTMNWIESNRETRLKEVMIRKKRKKEIAIALLTWSTGFLAVIGVMSWFEVNVVARVAFMIAFATFGVLAMGKDEE